MVNSTRPRFAIVSLVVLVALLVGSAYAVGAAFSPAATKVTRANKAAQRIVVVTETDATSMSSATTTTIPGASSYITIPAGQTGILVARFSGQSNCSGSAGYICMIKMQYSSDGSTWSNFSSATGGWKTFDSSAVGGDWESHAAEFVSPRLSAGKWWVRAQYALNIQPGGVTFGLSNWTWVVEFWRKS